MNETWYTLSNPQGDLVINGKVDTGDAVAWLFTTEQLASTFVVQRGMPASVESNSRDQIRRWLIFNRDVNDVSLVVKDPDPDGSGWCPMPTDLLLAVLDVAQ